MAGILPVRLEPLTYVVVLIALGLALWPRRLPLGEFTPAAVGGSLMLYGGLALAIVLVNREPIALLELGPIIAIVALAAGRIVRGLPPLEPPLISGAAERWSSGAVTVLGSMRVVLVGGLLLTAADLVLLLSRLIGTEDRLGWLPRFGVMPPGVVVLLLLIASGIATIGFIAWHSVRLRQAGLAS